MCIIYVCNKLFQLIFTNNLFFYCTDNRSIHSSSLTVSRSICHARGVPPCPARPPAMHAPLSHTCPPPPATHAPPSPCMSPPWTEFLTHTSENITLPNFVAGGNKPNEQNSAKLPCSDFTSKGH